MSTLWNTRYYCATCDKPTTQAATECRHCGATFGLSQQEK